jgi:WD40 repeat protein
VIVWEAATGREVLKTTLRDHSVQAIALTADGRVVAFTLTSPTTNSFQRLTQGAVTVIDPATGAAKTVWMRPDRPSRFALSPDGRRAVCVSPQSKVAIVLDIPAGGVLHQIECQTGMMMRVAFSPAGRYLVTAGLPKELAVWDMESGALVHQFACPESFFGFNAAAVSGDGRQVAVGVGPGAGPPEVVLFHPTREPRRIPAKMPLVNAVEFSPDGRRVAAYSGGDSVIRVWDADTAREAIVLRGYPTTVRAIAFSPDGRHLAAGYRDGRVVVWDLDPSGQ